MTQSRIELEAANDMALALASKSPYGEAIFSSDGAYRYRLDRELPKQPGLSQTVMFVMLNPSTADAWTNDPTVARCIRFAYGWGYERLIVTNLFAFRSTDPKVIRAKGNLAVDECWGRIGPEPKKCNDAHIYEAAIASHLVVCAWGNHGALLNRGRDVYRLLYDDEISAEVKCLGVNKTGQPKHPLYLRADTELESFILL